MMGSVAPAAVKLTNLLLDALNGAYPEFKRRMRGLSTNPTGDVSGVNEGAPRSADSEFEGIRPAEGDCPARPHP